MGLEDTLLFACLFWAFILPTSSGTCDTSIVTPPRQLTLATLL